MSLRAFVNGVAIGVVLGILFAPDAGTETRKKIAKRANDIKDSVNDTYNDIADNVANKYGRMVNKADDLLNKTYSNGQEEPRSAFE